MLLYLLDIITNTINYFTVSCPYLYAKMHSQGENAHRKSVYSRSLATAFVEEQRKLARKYAPAAKQLNLGKDLSKGMPALVRQSLWTNTCEGSSSCSLRYTCIFRKLLSRFCIMRGLVANSIYIIWGSWTCRASGTFHKGKYNYAEINHWT